MKRLLSFAPLALLATIPAAAQSSRTVNVDRPRYDATRTVTHDGHGTVTRDTDITRTRDGTTASRDYTRSFTGNGWTASGTQTGFAGRTRSFSASGSRGTFPRRRFQRR